MLRVEMVKNWFRDLDPSNAWLKYEAEESGPVKLINWASCCEHKDRAESAEEFQSGVRDWRCNDLSFISRKSFTWNNSNLCSASFTKTSLWSTDSMDSLLPSRFLFNYWFFKNLSLFYHVLALVELLKTLLFTSFVMLWTCLLTNRNPLKI